MPRILPERQEQKKKIPCVANKVVSHSYWFFCSSLLLPFLVKFLLECITKLQFFFPDNDFVEICSVNMMEM